MCVFAFFPLLLHNPILFFLIISDIISKVKKKILGPPTFYKCMQKVFENSRAQQTLVGPLLRFYSTIVEEMFTDTSTLQ